QDLNFILDGLRELEQRGVNVLDCRKAEFAADEPVSRLRMICQSWKVMFQAEYSSGQPLRLLADLRAVVDTALAGGAELSTQTPAESAAQAPESEAESGEAQAASPRAMAASASAGTSGSQVVSDHSSSPGNDE